MAVQPSAAGSSSSLHLVFGHRKFTALIRSSCCVCHWRAAVALNRRNASFPAADRKALCADSSARSQPPPWQLGKAGQQTQVAVARRRNRPASAAYVDAHSTTQLPQKATPTRGHTSRSCHASGPKQLAHASTCSYTCDVTASVAFGAIRAATRRTASYTSALCIPSRVRAGLRSIEKVLRQLAQWRTPAPTGRASVRQLSPQSRD